MAILGVKGGLGPPLPPKSLIFDGSWKTEDMRPGGYRIISKEYYSFIIFLDISSTLTQTFIYTLSLQVFSVDYLFVGIYFRVRVFYNIILALLLKLASNGSLLVQTIYIVSGIIAMLVTLST